MVDDTYVKEVRKNTTENIKNLRDDFENYPIWMNLTLNVLLFLCAQFPKSCKKVLLDTRWADSTESWLNILSGEIDLRFWELTHVTEFNFEFLKKTKCLNLWANNEKTSKTEKNFNFYWHKRFCAFCFPLLLKNVSEESRFRAFTNISASFWFPSYTLKK